jgi:hypothetical protein
MYLGRIASEVLRSMSATATPRDPLAGDASRDASASAEAASACDEPPDAAREHDAVAR